MDRNDSRNDIRKLSPLEQAIAERSDRRRRYDARMRDAGFKKTTVYVRAERLAEVKAFIEQVNAD